MFQRILVPVDEATPRIGASTKPSSWRPASRRRCACSTSWIDFVAAQGMDTVMLRRRRIFRRDHEESAQRRPKASGEGRSQGPQGRGKVEPLLLETVGHRVAEIILKQAKKVRADLIVIGSTWTPGVARLVMGSDAEGIVHGARNPCCSCVLPKDRCLVANGTVRNLRSFSHAALEGWWSPPADNISGPLASEGMPPTLFGFVWVRRVNQVWISVAAIAVFALNTAPLELQRRILNAIVHERQHQAWCSGSGAAYVGVVMPRGSSSS